ncbi:MAG: hypothetical protein IT535_11310 [Bauldia sp.]|nr:hypothetical protein [Bauldia sp.]
MKVSEEMLMAFADGELDADTAGEVRKAIDADPILQRRLRVFEETRLGAKAAFAGILDEPVPAQLVAALSTPRRGFRDWLRSRAFAGQAAGGLALAAAGFFAALVLVDRPSPGLLDGEMALASLLESAPGGATERWKDGSFQATGTYLVADGVCRSFTAVPSDTASGWRGVACRRDGAWTVDLAVAEPAGSFTTASDRATEAIDAFLDQVGAGASLDLAAEERARLAGWNIAPPRE